MTSLPTSACSDKAFDVVGVGENSVDHLCVVPRFPGNGDKLRLSRYELQGGGQVATAMVASSRLGLRSRYLGKVGSDALGEIALRELEAEGVDTAGIIKTSAQTRLAFILIDEATGERTVASAEDERLRIAPSELSHEHVTSARALHVDATSPAASQRALGWAREAGMLTCIDIDQVFPDAEDLVADVDLCVMSERFPLELTGEHDRGRALKAMRRWNKKGFLCVTLGADGCMALIDEVVVHVPAFSVHAVDTTACGDVFHAAILCAALEGMAPHEALRFANAAAALKTRKLGGRPGIPTRAEVESFLRSHQRLSARG